MKRLVLILGLALGSLSLFSQVDSLSAGQVWDIDGPVGVYPGTSTTVIGFDGNTVIHTNPRYYCVTMESSIDAFIERYKATGAVASTIIVPCNRVRVEELCNKYGIEVPVNIE